jgi:hypothetical protein
MRGFGGLERARQRAPERSEAAVVAGARQGEEAAFERLDVVGGAALRARLIGRGQRLVCHPDQPPPQGAVADQARAACGIVGVYRGAY